MGTIKPELIGLEEVERWNTDESDTAKFDNEGKWFIEYHVWISNGRKSRFDFRKKRPAFTSPGVWLLVCSDEFAKNPESEDYRQRVPHARVGAAPSEKQLNQYVQEILDQIGETDQATLIKRLGEKFYLA